MLSQSLSQGLIYPSFKRAAIVPIFKSGNKTTPGNFKPLSLTSSIIKVIERITRTQGVSFNNRLHGFTSSRSCLSYLLSVFDDMMHMLDSDSFVDMVFLDFQMHSTRLIMELFYIRN